MIDVPWMQWCLQKFSGFIQAVNLSSRRAIYVDAFQVTRFPRTMIGSTGALGSAAVLGCKRTAHILASTTALASRSGYLRY